jgi:CubicO group peptidase (beta-lactamase class C family)
MAEAFPEEPPITILNLLTHTAGLPREPLFDHWLSNRFPDWPAIKELLPSQQTILPRDSKWKYSNLALALAGEIVAAAAGQPYHSYVREQILQPLNMTDSYIETIAAADARLATGNGHRQSNGQRTVAPHTDAAGLSAAFNLATTAIDLAKFASFQLRADDDADNRVLRARTRREMHRPHWVNPDWSGGWGIGFEILRQNGQTFHGHGGAVQGFRTGVYFNLAEKLGAVALTNTDDGDPVTILTKALTWFGPAILAARQTPDAREELPAEWAAYYGRYRNVWGDQEILAYHGQLVAISPDAPDPAARLVILEPAGKPHHFRLNHPQTGFGSHGEIIHFELDGSGRASRLVGPGAATNGSDRIEAW